VPRILSIGHQVHSAARKCFPGRARDLRPHRELLRAVFGPNIGDDEADDHGAFSSFSFSQWPGGPEGPGRSVRTLRSGW
jgi:hypothetical protein